MHSEQAIYSGQLLHLQPRKELNYIFLKIWPNQSRLVKVKDIPVRFTISAIHPKANGFGKPATLYN